ncbi:MAG: signal peptidase II [Chloroflexi bacterium]|nr:signal peptidase II [Chloroflexota bacterium]
MKKYVWSYTFLFVFSGAIVALDQWTKALVREQLPLGASWSPWPWLAPFARVIHWNNTGAAFGMLQNFGTVFMVLAILVSIAIIYYFPKLPEGDWWLKIALGLQLSGAVGNLIDRLTTGQVTDFISVGSFPVFNVADSSITVGVILLLLIIWIRDLQAKKPNTPAATIPSNPDDSPGSPESQQGG